MNPFSAQFGARSPIAAKVNPRPGSAGSNRFPNLWVEDGVIWSLPKLVLGFTDPHSAAVFFKSMNPSMGLAGSNWYANFPWPASAMPTLAALKPPTVNVSYSVQSPYDANAQTGASPGTALMIWANITVAGSLASKLASLPAALTPSPASSGLVLPASVFTGFRADSRTGAHTFRAHSILYVANPAVQPPASSFGADASDAYYWFYGATSGQTGRAHSGLP